MKEEKKKIDVEAEFVEIKIMVDNIEMNKAQYDKTKGKLAGRRTRVGVAKVIEKLSDIRKDTPLLLKE